MSGEWPQGRVGSRTSTEALSVSQCPAARQDDEVALSPPTRPAKGRFATNGTLKSALTVNALQARNPVELDRARVC
jgi:hypothetical protein